MSLRLFTLSAILAAARLVAADAAETPAQDPVLGTDTVHGCYSSYGSMVFNSSSTFNTQGLCTEACRNLNKNTAATQSKECYCGDKYPAKNLLVDDSECTEPCPGYDTQVCGGADTWTVYNTGVRVSVSDEANATDTSSTSSSSSSTTTAAAVVTVSGSVTTITPTPTPSSSSSKSSTVGIAVGSVVGVVGLAGAAGSIFFLMKRRRNREIEEEHRRNAAVNAFMAGGKAPSSSGGLSISDQRLDPVMVQRRLSSGSIADEQDYSRRILRVTNA